MSSKLTGHKATFEWNGETGAESMNTVRCICGFSETTSSRRESTFEYNNHKAAKRRELDELIFKLCRMD